MQFDDSIQLKLFLKESGQSEIAEVIKDACPVVPCSVYLVRTLNGNSGVELLPKWVVQSGFFCAYYDGTLEDEVTGTQVSISRAVLELLQ